MRRTVPFAIQVRAAGIPPFKPELVFHPGRRWQFDWAWPDWKIALEFEGGTWVAGRHSRGQGFENDCRKYNAAAADGWAVIRVTTDMVAEGTALEDLRAAFAARGLE